MTTAEKKRVAAAARELAMECVNGTAPKFGVDAKFDRHGRPHCAIGHVEYRACVLPVWSEKTHPDLICVTEANDAGGILTDKAVRERRLVFPLLALADAIMASK